MYGYGPQNQTFFPTPQRYLPGMPGSFTPPWVIPMLPESMVQSVQPQDGRPFAVQTMPMHQYAMTPPIVAVANRMQTPPPTLTDPNSMYSLPPINQQTWLG
ncbi:MAG: hypothetical protein AB7V50_08415 [Vampirovibrionia bacterium]